MKDQAAVKEHDDQGANATQAVEAVKSLCRHGIDLQGSRVKEPEMPLEIRMRLTAAGERGRASVLHHAQSAASVPAINGQGALNYCIELFRPTSPVERAACFG
jgi:hypothetical protein